MFFSLVYIHHIQSIYFLYISFLWEGREGCGFFFKDQIPFLTSCSSSRILKLLNLNLSLPRLDLTCSATVLTLHEYNQSISDTLSPQEKSPSRLVALWGSDKMLTVDPAFPSGTRPRGPSEWAFCSPCTRWWESLWVWWVCCEVWGMCYGLCKVIVWIFDLSNAAILL